MMGYTCPQIPSLYPIYIVLASIFVLSAVLSAAVNIKRVFVDRVRAMWEPFREE